MADERKYRILCRVSGGVTGTRIGWLKENDRVVEFTDLALADAEAARLNLAMNGPHAKASFHYQVTYELTWQDGPLARERWSSGEGFPWR